MTAKQWMDANAGKHLDFDGYYGAQCKDLINFYSRDVVGVRFNAGNAIDAWNAYPTAAYTKIVNTPTFVPRCGDIMVWGTKVGQYGHIAICTGEGNVNYFVSLDQNWPFDNGAGVAHYVRHNYSGVLGVLRPNKDVNFDQAAYDAQKQAEEIARKAKEEADRKAAEEIARKLAEQAEIERKAKAEADARIAAENAKQAELQARLAEEQAKLEEELKAKQLAEKKENTMLKGFRTYAAIIVMVLTAILAAVKVIPMQPELLALVEAVLGALAAYFRSQA